MLSYSKSCTSLRNVKITAAPHPSNQFKSDADKIPQLFKVKCMCDKGTKGNSMIPTPWCSKTKTFGRVIRSEFLFAVSCQNCNRQRGGQRWATIMSALCSSSVSIFHLMPLLRRASLVFLFFHVSACHPLPPLCQPLTPGAVFTCSEAVAMVACVAIWKKNPKKTTNYNHHTELKMCHVSCVQGIQGKEVLNQTMLHCLQS